MYAAATLNEGVASHTNMLLNDYTVALDRAVVNFAFACHAGADADDTTIEHLYIMADVTAFHKEIVVADSGGLSVVSAAGDNHILADTVIVADNDLRLVAFHEMEVLRRGAYDRVLVDNIAASHSGAFENAGVRFDDAVVANDYTLLNAGKRAYFHVLTQFGFGVNVC